MEVKVTRLERNDQIQLEHPNVEILVCDLDCGGRGINKDMQKTLNADEYPVIKIRVQSADIGQMIQSPQNREPREIMVLTCISISGVERCLDIPVLVVNKPSNETQFCGSIPLTMTEFGLIPPTALMGMIQAENNINVSFEMNIKVNQK